jgi:hypothetical protein
MRHSAKDQYKCDTCDLKTSSEGTMRRHQQIHFGKLGSLEVCPVDGCNYDNNRTDTITAHVANVHGKFLCDYRGGHKCWQFVPNPYDKCPEHDKDATEMSTDPELCSEYVPTIHNKASSANVIQYTPEDINSMTLEDMKRDDHTMKVVLNYFGWPDVGDWNINLQLSNQMEGGDSYDESDILRIIQEEQE